MTLLYDGYLLAGIGVAAATVWGFMRTIRKVDKSVERVEAQAPILQEAAATLQTALDKQHQHNLGWEVESYEAVKAANGALGEVITNSTRQLAEAAVQVAQSTAELRRVQTERDQALIDKALLEARVSTLEATVAKLEARLEYFTHPPQGLIEGGHSHKGQGGHT
jgi:chromosome segregation ATPase